MKIRITLARATCYVAAMQELTRQQDVEHARLKHGLELALNGDAYYSHVAGSWICASASTPNKIYAVDLQRGICSCRDHLERGVYCKHLVAAFLTGRVIEILTHAETLQKDPTQVEWALPAAA